MIESFTHRLKVGELEEVLTKSFTEFKITERADQLSMLSKYATAASKSSLWKVELRQKNTLVASAITCSQVFPIERNEVQLSFLTQVIVQPLFRGQGHLKQLIECVGEVDRRIGSSGSIVIARRGVSNLYSKYSYEGFGIFPSVDLQSLSISSINEDMSLQLDVNVEMTNLFATAYESTYWKIPGTTMRNKTDWNHIFRENKSGRLKINFVKNGATFVYSISKENVVIELAATDHESLNASLSDVIDNGVTKIRIGANHPAFSVAMSKGGIYSVRPEPFEGHMIRRWKTLDTLDRLLRFNTAGNINTNARNNSFSIEISELNQW